MKKRWTMRRALLVLCIASVVFALLLQTFLFHQSLRRQIRAESISDHEISLNKMQTDLSNFIHTIRGEMLTIYSEQDLIAAMREAAEKDTDMKDYYWRSWYFARKRFTKEDQLLAMYLYLSLIHIQMCIRDSGGRRHYNYNSPVYQRLCARVVEREAAHYAKHPAIVGWQIDNEINCEVNEFYSEADSVVFREFLRKQYGTCLLYTSRLQGYSHLASGSNSVMYWHWHSIHNSFETYWKGLLSHDMQENAPYREACIMGKEFSEIGSHLVNLKKKNDVAILVSNEALTALKLSLIHI